MSETTDPAEISANLYALVTPQANGRWRFDLRYTRDDGEGIRLADAVYMLNDVETWGWARSRERAEEKARKQILKVRRRLDNLAQKSSVVRVAAGSPQNGEPA